MKIGARIITIIISVLAILNVIFLPIFENGCGLFPEEVAVDFTTAFKLLYESFDNWQLWAVQLTVLMLIPSVFMFLSSLLGKKGLFVISSLFGIAIWAIEVAVYSVSDHQVSGILDFSGGSFAIGMWVALVLFIIGFFVGIAAKKKAKKADAK